MRHIGKLPDEKQARLFGDFLIASGVRNEMERDTDGSFTVWIYDDDHVAAGQAWLEKFRSNPAATEFSNAGSAAAKARAAEAEDLAAYRKRVHGRRSLFPKLGRYGMGILTCVLIGACIVVAFMSDFGKGSAKLLDYILISNLPNAAGLFTEVKAGEVWRLWTPIFLHLGPMHLLFNMMWLYRLGNMIEARQGALRLGMVILGTGLVSNLVQYFVSGGFGGMSGVVFALVGYIWMQARFNRASGLTLSSMDVTYQLIWLVLCFTGWVGPIANGAHVGGLIAGMVWGRLAAHFAMRKPE